MAGAPFAVAGRLALGMLGIQFGIGAANDVLDLPSDAHRRDKPVPAGIVGPRPAAGMAVAFAAGGVALASTVRAEALLVALAGLAVGLAYDLRLKGTAWAWTAFAFGVGLLPVYALWGATGCFAPAYAVVFSLAVVGGASLAMANALSDLGTDETSGLATIATKLGPSRTFAADALLFVAVQAIAVGSAIAFGSATPDRLVLFGFVAGAAIGCGGLALTWARPARAQRAGWEIQAIALLVTGVAWLGALQANVLRAC